MTSLAEEHRLAASKAESLGRTLAKYPAAMRTDDGRIQAAVAVQDFTMCDVEKTSDGRVWARFGDGSTGENVWSSDRVEVEDLLFSLLEVEGGPTVLAKALAPMCVPPKKEPP